MQVIRMWTRRGASVGWQGRGCVGLSRHSVECPSHPPVQGVGPFIKDQDRLHSPVCPGQQGWACVSPGALRTLVLESHI